MLFNSVEFIFIFLPITLGVFFLVGSKNHHMAATMWLVGASLFFYGWWKPVYLALIFVSILFNYSIGILLSRDSLRREGGKMALAAGITANLVLLAYFKYTNFFVNNLNDLFGYSFQLKEIILPLAISFFTFQQITYLVDAYNGEAREYNFLHYCLFVSFFPQLIAGPIVHHREILPQFANKAIYRFNSGNIAVGLTIFILGLFKKVVIADGLNRYVTPVFDAAEMNIQLSFIESWCGTIAYTFQLYFDFSGYSDMALGLARMFGILLPLNFNSPYKATNIIDFWRRWHMTLSRFLRDYLYIPLGGNRRGVAKRYLFIMITMSLGGLWHGSAWTFVFWGGLHGFYLVTNHVWRSIIKYRSKPLPFFYGGFSRLLTFFSVVVAWGIFRADSFYGAINILKGMSGFNGFTITEEYGEILNHFFGLGGMLASLGVESRHMDYFSGNGELLIFFTLLIVVWYMPNTQQIMQRYRISIEDVKYKRLNPLLQWEPKLITGLCVGIILFISVVTICSAPKSEFIYFNF